MRIIILTEEQIKAIIEIGNTCTILNIGIQDSPPNEVFIEYIAPDDTKHVLKV